LEDMGACGKAKGHLTKKHKGLKVGWYIGAGERVRSGTFLVPRFWMSWGTLLDGVQPMWAPQLVWLAFLELAAETPVSLEMIFCSNRNLKTPVMTRTLHLPKPYDRPTLHTEMQPRIVKFTPPPHCAVQ
jgi:hypothetical protein